MRRGFGFHDRHSPFRFNPATLFGGVLPGTFYDPSDLSTLFQDAAGTIPVTSIGDPVGRILDKSGNGNHATQSTAASRPLLQQTNGLYHLTFDGSNDSLLTGTINFTSTNKITVFSGLSKLSDAAVGTVAELSASTSGNAGSFGVFAPRDPTPSSNFGYHLYVTAENVRRTAAIPAPITSVMTVIYDTAQAASNQIVSRFNGVQQSLTGSIGSGAGNFGNYPLYIGRRNNATLPFNGRLYGLIVLGAAASDWQIQVTEQWMAGKTGVTI